MSKLWRLDLAGRNYYCVPHPEAWPQYEADQQGARDCAEIVGGVQLPNAFPDAAANI